MINGLSVVEYTWSIEFDTHSHSDTTHE